MFHFIVVVVVVVVLAVSSCFSLDMTVHVDVVVVVVLGVAWFHEIKLFFRSRKEFFFSLVVELDFSPISQPKNVDTFVTRCPSFLTFNSSFSFSKIAHDVVLKKVTDSPLFISANGKIQNNI